MRLRELGRALLDSPLQGGIRLMKVSGHCIKRLTEFPNLVMPHDWHCLL
jgi:hypothetical protein